MEQETGKPKTPTPLLIPFKDKTPFTYREVMTETKQCSKCKVFRQLNQIEESNKNCNVCLEQRRRYRQRQKEEINIRSKAYREKNREELNMKQNEKAECPICKCMIRRHAMNRHQQSNKHQHNLNKTQTTP